MNIKVIGTGSALPKKIVSNDDLSKIMDTSDEWIRSRTGIVTRHLAVEETTTSMSIEAAEAALKNAGINAEDVDIIIAATISADKVLPGLACEVQSGIGASHAVAFDINAACSGFLFSLNTAEMYLRSGVYKTALVIGAETLSKMMDWNDRSTCVLFGDGAGVAILQAEEGDGKEGILAMVQGSDGSRGEVLSCANRPNNNPYQANDTALDYVQMNGQEVYKFAVKTVPEAISEVVEKAGISLDDVDHFILHQANYRIIEAVAKRLKQPMEKFPTNLQECGNISAASVPILLDNVRNHGIMSTDIIPPNGMSRPRDSMSEGHGRINKGDKIVLAGFGAGLTWGATVLTW